jgi:hypothetical protein
MAIVSISEASRQWRVGRSNLYRAVKSGRLNLSARPDGSRGVDVSEMVRVFGEPSARTSNLSADTDSPPEPNGREQERTLSPVVLLQAQVDQLSAQLEQSQTEKSRLLSLLEAEQQARGALETKRLPAPSPVPSGIRRPWILLVLLLAALALAGWWWRAVIVAALAR